MGKKAALKNCGEKKEVAEIVMHFGVS